MIVHRIFAPTLAQTSYLLGCERTRTAIVIDPNRDLDQYIRAADSDGLAITHVTETHIHADFLSGARELAARTGARLYLSDEGDASGKYAYAPAAVLVRDRDHLDVGDIGIDVVHTPGHTPEHISFLVTDKATADQPIAIVTGDFVFVGDVGRPDLLERAAKIEGTMESAARALFESLQRFKAYPDWLQIWPGHSAGSACGKGISAVPHSTVGYERRFNWAFQHTDEDRFVTAVLNGQPEPPPYFGQMKSMNQRGPSVRYRVRRLEPATVETLGAALRSGVAVVDTRDPAEYAAAHVPGTLNIPLSKSFTTWAGWFLPYDRAVILVVQDEDSIDQAVRDLAMIGIDRVIGFATRELIADWDAAGLAVARIEQVTAAELFTRMAVEDLTVLDVRSRAEWEAGHIPGVDNVPVAHVVDVVAAIPRDTAVVVYCQSGTRSAIAAGVLSARGFGRVMNLKGGFADWQRADRPVTRRPLVLDATPLRRKTDHAATAAVSTHGAYRDHDTS